MEMRDACKLWRDAARDPKCFARRHKLGPADQVFEDETEEEVEAEADAFLKATTLTLTLTLTRILMSSCISPSSRNRACFDLPPPSRHLA